jgi:hypothetical protein
MHAGFLFCQSSLQLAYTTQAWIFNWKTCAMQASICNAHSNASFKSMSLLPLLVCFKILSDPFLCHFSSPITYIFVSLPFVIKYHKRWAQILDRFGWNHIMWGSFYSIWFNLDPLPKKFNSVWSKDKLLHATYIGYLVHVELNPLSTLARLNTRIASPQTCHMLPLDHIKHRSNSGTIQASNSFDFHK